jgi:phytoene dehydrogenase-like protein
MADYDAIVVDAGHNGLTAAVLLQRAGLRTLCLESKLYAGGMASTVELFDGYQFEIAGSLQLSTSAVVSRELGLDALPTVDLDVMSVSLRGVGDYPVVYYTDPMKLLTHFRIRAGGPQRGRGADQEAARRHRRADPAPARAVHR